MNLHFNHSLATGYHSGSQISRVLTEDWMERNMFCPVCGAPVLGHYVHRGTYCVQKMKQVSVPAVPVPAVPDPLLAEAGSKAFTMRAGSC